ncbi:MAG TPA: MFS transporter [Gemmatimonadales bacterium]|nr:MFS transporter [Gemmatimonadales bacterium]
MPVAARNPFHALRHRNFRLFYIGQFISLTGTWMQVVALGWLVLQLTNSAFQVGLVSTLGSLPILAFTLWGGVLADRVDRRRALMLFHTLMLGDALVLGILTLTGGVTVGWVQLLAVVHGTSAAFEVPIRQAFLLELVEPDELMNAIALNSSNFNLTRILGPGIAGLVIGFAGVAPCFLLNAASFLAVLASLALIRIATLRPPPEAGTAFSNFMVGVRYAMGEREPRHLLALTAIYSVFGFSFVTMLPVFARDVLHSGAQGYGGLMTAVGLGASVGALTMAALGHRISRHRVIRLAGLLFAGSLSACALARLWSLAALILAVTGGAMILNNVAVNTQLQTTSPDGLRGRVMGFYSLMVLGMAPFGSLQAGWVSEHLGVPTSLALGGAVCALAVLWLAEGPGPG